MRKGDYVKTPHNPRLGRVTRVASDGSWVDVDWRGWSKRMKADAVEVYDGPVVVRTGQQKRGEVDDATR